MSNVKLDGLAPIFATCAQVNAAWLFGSTIKQTRRPDSDLDIAVWFNTPPDFDTLTDLRLALQTPISFAEIDLVVLNRANPILCFEAVCGQVLYQRNLSEWAAFVSLVAREYEDTMAMVTAHLVKLDRHL